MITATLSARQAAPGAPIKAIARTTFNTVAEYDNDYNAGLGVKVGATPPTNTSEFAESWLYTDTGTVLASAVSANSYRDGALTAATQRAQQTRTIPMGGAVVAGRYLFAFKVGAGGALTAVSPGYLII